jgi:argininosuccinate synthase
MVLREPLSGNVGAALMARKKVVLAYSGGLDTSVAIKWIADTYQADVYTMTVDLSQGDLQLKEVEAKARKVGAKEAFTVDAKEEFVHRFVFPALQANALYENKYPLATALGRPLIAEKLVEVALRVGADAIAHGCTAKGNDQVRF